MQRSLYQQAVRMHGQDLSILTEKHQQEKFAFVDEENEEQQLADIKAEECDERESSANHPDTTAVAPYQDGVRLTGTMRDLVHVQSRTTIDSSTEESSKSDTSPEILPLGVPRELHERFEDLPSNSKTKSLKNNGFVSRLQNFISKKADILYKATTADKEPSTLPNVQDTVDLDYYATLPPMEQFMVVPPDQSRKRLFEILSIGDIIAGSIVAIKDFGMFVQVVCLCGKEVRYLQECDIVGLLPKGELGDRYSQKAQLEDFRAGDVVRCRVVKTDAANEKVILTMINQGDQKEESLLGIISESDLPVHYRRSQTQRETRELYDEMLDNTLGFDNPYNISCLANMLAIDDANPPSLMPALQSSNFPTEEHAEALRKWQSHKWAMESVARGVEHFKANRHLEAMQQLNRALEIDAENVEGLVARGALFANQNNLSKAIKDFAEALRVKPSHKNANRYMCQTLYEKGKQCEENGEKDKAMDCYQSAVDLNPDFQDALVSLQRLEKPSRRKSVRDVSEEEGVVISTSEESPQEQMSAKQLREMISGEKSSAKKKKKKDKHSKGHEEGKGDMKVKKELKMGKKKKKKKLRRRSSSPEVISKQKHKESSSDSESESSSPPSPVPKHKDIKKGSRVDNAKEQLSPEVGRLTGRKRSRNGSLSPQRKSRSKTRKADLIRKKYKHTSETSSSDEDKHIELEPKKDKRNHSKSVERSDSTKAKRKGDKIRSRKESESSSCISSSEEEQLKKSKKGSKKEGKERKVKDEVSHKKRKMKAKKEKMKRSRSSSSVSEETADSLSFSPMRKKSKQSKKVKKMHKKSKKRSESVSSVSASGSESDRKPSPPRKVHKKKKRNKKKKPKKKERSTSVSSQSVLSSESPERTRSPEEPAKNRKHKKKTKEEDHYSDRSSSDGSSSLKQPKISKGKRDVKTSINDESPAKSDRRSRSASVGKKERAPKESSDEGEDIKIGKKRSRSNEYSLVPHKDNPKRQSSKEAVYSPPSERERRRKKTSDVLSDDSEKEEHIRRKDERTERKLVESPIEERPQSAGKERTRNKEKNDKREDESRSSRRSKRRSKAQSPVEYRKERSLSKERNKSDDRDKKKSRKSLSPAPLSPRSKGPSEDHKQDKVAKQSEYRGERSVSSEKHKSDERVKKKHCRSYSSASESPPRTRSSEDHEWTKSKEETLEKLSKSSRRSGSLSPKTRKEEPKEQGVPIRERKRKRSGSFKAESCSLEKGRQDRKSRDSDNDEEKDRGRKESGSLTRSRDDSPQGRSHHTKSADNRMDRRRGSPRESKKSNSKRSPSPPERKDNRHRSREEIDPNKSRNSRSTSADFHERKQRSKSGSYDRDRGVDRRSGDKDRDTNRRESKDGNRRKSGSLDREGHTQERRMSDGDRHRNSEDYKHKSRERDHPRSREEERKRENRDSDRRTSHEGNKDDRDKGSDRSKERQYHNHEKSSHRKSRERERSKERDRRETGRNADSSRERRDRSRERDRSKERERGISGSRSESIRGDKKVPSEQSRENGKAGTKGQESEHHQSQKLAPTLNIKDIPMPPEKAPVVEAKKEPSPIMYITSTSCKDEIIKVKSKWDTDSEDEEDGASGPSQNRRGGGGRGTSAGQRSYAPSSQFSCNSGNGSFSGGQNHGGYRRYGDEKCLDNTSSTSNSSGTSQSCLDLSFLLLAEQSSYHEPLRLRGGCVASPPPKYESDYSDSDVSFSSSSSVDSEEPSVGSSYEGQLRVGRRPKSSSSDRSSGGRSKKRFKPSTGRESWSSSRSSSASSSRSQSSRSSSRSDISLSSRSRSRSPSSSSRSSSNFSSRSHSSDSKLSKSSKSSHPSVKSKESSKRSRKTHGGEDVRSSTENSGSEGASAYNLFDSWEDYMDSKGHDIGKQVPSSIRDQRTVKLEAGGSTVGKHSRKSPVSTYVEASSEEDEESFVTTDHHFVSEKNVKEVRKTAQTESTDDDDVSVGKAKCGGSIIEVNENERKSNSDAAGDERRGLTETQGHMSLGVEDDKLALHPRKQYDDQFVTRPQMEKAKPRHFPDTRADGRYSGRYEHESRVGRGPSSERYSRDQTSAGDYSRGYGNQLKVALGHRSSHYKEVPNVKGGYRAEDQNVRDGRSDRYNNERHYRSNRSYVENRSHPRHDFPLQEERRDHYQRPERGFESQRYGRRGHSFRRRRDDDDWGRGVKEVKERGTFFGLVTKSKEGLVSQLYSACSTAMELVQSEHRQWWL